MVSCMESPHLHDENVEFRAGKLRRFRSDSEQNIIQYAVQHRVYKNKRHPPTCRKGIVRSDPQTVGDGGPPEAVL